MASSRQPMISAEDRLGLLAMEFRGTSDEAKRAKIAADYERLVADLIASEKWTELPSFEEMLPDAQMPDAFYIYWSIPSPKDNAPVQREKIAFFVEGKTDAAILAAILPPRVVTASTMYSTAGQQDLITEAAKHLAQHCTPVAIAFDTNTLNKEAVGRAVRDMSAKMTTLVGTLPFQIFAFIPHVETLIFKSTKPLQRIFPGFTAVFKRALAERDPKKQLEALMEKGGGPKTLKDVLDKLTDKDLEQIQRTSPVSKMIAFVAANPDADMRNGQ